MNFFRTYQLDYLLMLSGISLIIAIFTLILRFDNRKTKFSLFAMEICAFVLVASDRYAYIFRGNESTLGFWMVRITNFFVFFSMLAENFAFDVYITSVLNLKKAPKKSYVIRAILVVGMLCLFISQFTGWYYTFDSTNHYRRSKGFAVCYLFPVVALILQSTMIAKNRKKLSKRIKFSVIMFPSSLFLVAIVQLFAYGLSLNTMSYASFVIILFMCAIYESNEKIEAAQQKEIAVLKEQAKNMQELFAQTAEALSGAIDAKDEYTHGHSVRVAEYSRKMAEMAGLSEQECSEVYFAGLLHDVGKIGIPDSIINKDSKLSNEEFAEIKKHPVMGNEILSSISKLPYLSVGALYQSIKVDKKNYFFNASFTRVDKSKPLFSSSLIEEDISEQNPSSSFTEVDSFF